MDKYILVGVDDTPESQPALHWAVEAAEGRVGRGEGAVPGGRGPGTAHNSSNCRRQRRLSWSVPVAGAVSPVCYWDPSARALLHHADTPVAIVRRHEES